MHAGDADTDAPLCPLRGCVGSSAHSHALRPALYAGVDCVVYCAICVLRPTVVRAPPPRPTPSLAHSAYALRQCIGTKASKKELCYTP